MGCHFLFQCMKVKSESEVAQSCPTLRDPMDRSLPGSSIHGICQARVLEWGAFAWPPATLTPCWFSNPLKHRNNFHFGLSHYMRVSQFFFFVWVVRSMAFWKYIYFSIQYTHTHMHTHQKFHETCLVCEVHSDIFTSMKVPVSLKNVGHDPLKWCHDPRWINPFGLKSPQ